MDAPRDGDGGPGPSPLRYLGLGFELIAPVLVAMGLGYWLDGKFGTGPWLTVGGAVLGIVTGFVQFFRSVLPAKPDRDGPERNGGDR